MTKYCVTLGPVTVRSVARPYPRPFLAPRPFSFLLLLGRAVQVNIALATCTSLCSTGDLDHRTNPMESCQCDRDHLPDPLCRSDCTL